MKPEIQDAIAKDIHWLSQEIGPRPAHSTEVRLATLGVRDRLVDAGWSPKFVHLPNNLVACKGTGRIVLLAHVDTVPESPGTIDNAVGVATLLAMARQYPNADLCIGFPAQEELGLIGSRVLADQIDAWHPDASKVELVLSLDLVGQGRLYVTGLHRRWTDARLHTLLETPHLQSEYGYQVVSRLFPVLERSDHAPFASNGYLSAQLLGRDLDGLIPHYHQSNDTVFEEKSVEQLVEALESIVAQDWSSEDTATWKHSATFGDTLLPWWALYSILVLAIGAGIHQLWTRGFFLRSSLVALALSVLFGVLSTIPSLTSSFPTDVYELESYVLTGLVPTGWWMGSAFFLPIFGGLSALLHSHPRVHLSGNSTGWWGLCTLGLSIVDPVLAFPWAVATLLSLVHPLLSLLGVAYWLQPNILRQLAVHSLLPPYAWGLLAVFGFAALLHNADLDADKGT